MKIEQRGNNWRVRKHVGNKNISVSFDHRPTQKEATLAIAEKISQLETMEDTKQSKNSFDACVESYFKAHTEIFSPSTINGYKTLQKALSDDFRALKIGDIDQIAVQQEINRYAEEHAPKTVKNLYGFIQSVLGYYRPNYHMNIKLPQKECRDVYTPIDEDVKKILADVKGTRYEIAMRLGVYGLRRSEILPITADDLDGNMLTINKAKVYNGKGYTVKQTKTTMSTRTIYIDDELAKLIREQGKAWEGNPHLILQQLHRSQRKLGIYEFRFHDLRYYYVSMAHALGIPDVYIQASGGWSSPATMNRVYKHTLKDKEKEMMQKASEHIQGLF